MAKKTAKENLKSFSWVYIILSVLYLVAALICNLVPDIVDTFKDHLGEDAMFTLNVAVAVNILIYLLYFYLSRRVASSKSDGTFYMILLIISIASKVMSVVTTRTIASITSFDFIVDAMGLAYLLKARKD